MPSATSYADIINSLQALLEAIDRTPEIQSSIEAEREALEDSLAEVKSLKAQQDELTARRQETTQKLVDAVMRARDVAIRIRSIVRGKIGPHSERLVQFNVAPLRRRPRRSPEKPPEPPPPPVEVTAQPVE